MSLDVFDTLLLRNDVPEARRFWEIAGDCADRLGAGDQLNHFRARQEAMRLSYRARPAVEGCRDGCINDVLRMQCGSLGLPTSRAAEMREIEISVEAASLAPNMGILQAAAEFRERGGTAILISDMDLDGDAIADIIRRVHNHAEVFDALFSSADCVVCKRSGRIFPFVEEALRLAPSDFVHWGDSLDGDVRRPRAAGWRSHHFPVSDAEVAQRHDALTAFLQAAHAEGLHLAPSCQAQPQ